MLGNVLGNLYAWEHRLRGPMDVHGIVVLAIYVAVTAAVDMYLGPTGYPDLGRMETAERPQQTALS